jgi:hypothetical protein
MPRTSESTATKAKTLLCRKMPQGGADILQHRLQEAGSALIAAFLLELVASSELQRRCATGVRCVHLIENEIPLEPR